jgi:DNA-directed RNA polymerase specialized sigma24 family protein
MLGQGELAAPNGGNSGLFATTHWSVVLAAGRENTIASAEALERLCRTYWYPLYAFLRLKGRSPEDAQDLTQDFFAHLLTKGFPSGATPDRGRFRSFLLVSLKHFIIDQHRRAAAAKHGGGQSAVSLDVSGAEERFSGELQHSATPEKLYERAWANTLLDGARARLRAEYAAAGQGRSLRTAAVFPASGKGRCPVRASGRQARDDGRCPEVSGASDAEPLPRTGSGRGGPHGGRSVRVAGRSALLDRGDWRLRSARVDSRKAGTCAWDFAYI